MASPPEERAREAAGFSARMASPLQEERARAAVGFLARTASRLDRIPDMFAAVNKLATEYKDLTGEEHHLFCTAYFDLFSAKFHEIQTVKAIAKEENGDHSSSVDSYMELIESEMNASCREGERVLEEDLIPSCTVIQKAVVYYKILGDLFWYQLNLVTEEPNKQNLLQKALSSYEAAVNRSETLNPASPMRLSAQLNLSALYHDEAGNHGRAIHLAEKAILMASPYINVLDEASRRLSTDILELIKENYIMWLLLNALEVQEDKAPAPAAAEPQVDDAPPRPFVAQPQEDHEHVAPVVIEPPLIVEDHPPAPVAAEFQEDEVPPPPPAVVAPHLPVPAPLAGGRAPSPVRILNEVQEDKAPAPAAAEPQEDDAPPPPPFVAQPQEDHEHVAPVVIEPPLIVEDHPPAPVAAEFQEDEVPPPPPPAVVAPHLPVPAPLAGGRAPSPVRILNVPRAQPLTFASPNLCPRKDLSKGEIRRLRQAAQVERGKMG